MRALWHRLTALLHRPTHPPARPPVDAVDWVRDDPDVRWLRKQTRDAQRHTRHLRRRTMRQSLPVESDIFWTPSGHDPDAKGGR